MAFKVVWTEQAREDLRDIVQFIAADNFAIAETFGFLIVSKVDQLINFPFLAEWFPRLEKNPYARLLFVHTGLFTKLPSRSRQ
ncbi:conserved hypothetical protein [Pedosphaera parvula Ellin514]|uniref:Plasmid stabilization system n=1 Tax=Pedosphaera parvula (strain Ellin514) TaxID=320771 RepID=B9XHZ8_PEDPL|nr:conserved hypothetical protein [Pedosphaera parvula Ellin514]